jgi:hypothetical protein
LNQQPNLLIKKSIGPDCFKNKTNKMNQNRKNISEKERKKGRKEGKKEETPKFLMFLQKIQEEGTFPNSF